MLEHTTFGVKRVQRTYTIVRWSNHEGKACSQIFDEDEEEAKDELVRLLVNDNVFFSMDSLEPS